MTLEEQFRKETGEDSYKWTESSAYTHSYVNWLEERLTWNKFSEQKPNVGFKVFLRDGDVNSMLCAGRINSNKFNEKGKNERILFK